MKRLPDDPAAWTAGDRAVLVGELLAGRISPAAASQRYGIPIPTLERWRRRYLAAATAALEEEAEADVDERTREQLEYRIELDNLVLRLSATLISPRGDSLDEGINRALGEIGRFAGADTGRVFAVSDDGERFTMTHMWRRENLRPREMIIHETPTARIPWWMDQLRRGEAVVVDEVAELGPEARAEKRIFQAQGTRSVIDVPMFDEGRLVGFIGFTAVRQVRRWSQDELVLLRLMSDVLVQALHREEADRHLRQSEARLRTYIAQTSDAVWGLEHERPIPVDLSPEAQVEHILDGKLVVCNDVCAGFFGVESVAELLGKPLRETAADTLGKEGMRRLRTLCLRSVTSGHHLVEHEEVVVTPDGARRWAVHNVYGVVADGWLTHTWGTLRDVTERRRIERALARAKEEWEKTFDAVPELIVLTDEALRIVRLNRAISDRLGIDPRELSGLACTEIFDLAPGAGREEMSAALAGEKPSFEVRSEALGGQFLFSVSPRYDEGGRVIGRTLVGHDVTAQRRIEEMLRRSAMIDQAEQIFRTLRHEMGNALNTLQTTLSVLRNNFESFSHEQRETYFERALETCKVVERLLRSLKDYQNLDELHQGPLDLARFLDDSGGILCDSAGEHGVGCQIEVHHRPLPIEGDREALLRILFNLVENAIAAVADCPQPRIVVACRRLGGQAVLTVNDNGVGIPSKYLPRVFTPLFSTKADGSGIGLAVVQRLMLAMGGVARVRSKAGQGATVELSFPILPA